MNNELIEKVVKEVFEVLSQRHNLQSDSSTTNNHAEKNLSGNFICGEVITEELLQKEIRERKEIVFQPKAILTPSAKDFLREKQIQWRHESLSQLENKNESSPEWKVFVVTSSEQTENILKEINRTKEIKTKLSADLKEGVNEVVSEICRAEISKGIILTDSPEEAACLANRQEKVQAASVNSIKDLQRITENWNPNLYCVMPAGNSYYELRNLIRTIIGR